MSEVNISKRTKWSCIRCAECCKGIIPSNNQSLSVKKGDEIVCRYLKGKECNNYNERPFICRIYPFVLNIDKIMDSDGIARPLNAFLFENMKIHDECPGVGKGKRIMGNKNLIRKLDKLAYDFSLRFKEAHEKGDLTNLF